MLHNNCNCNNNNNYSCPVWACCVIPLMMRAVEVMKCGCVKFSLAVFQVTATLSHNSFYSIAILSLLIYQKYIPGYCCENHIFCKIAN